MTIFQTFKTYGEFKLSYVVKREDVGPKVYNETRKGYWRILKTLERKGYVEQFIRYQDQKKSGIWIPTKKLMSIIKAIPFRSYEEQV